MTRRIVVTFRLLLVAGLLAAPASSFAPGDRVVATGAEPASAAKISFSAVIPSLTPARAESRGQWLGARRDLQRTYSTRVWALVAPRIPLAIVLAFGVLGVVRGWRARLLIAARAISSRAPPAPAFA